MADWRSRWGLFPWGLYAQEPLDAPTTDRPTELVNLALAHRWGFDPWGILGSKEPPPVVIVDTPINTNPIGPWGLYPWGRSQRPHYAVPTVLPQITYRAPASGQVEVFPTDTLHIHFFHANGLLDPTSALVYVNDTLVFDGIFGFAPYITGSVTFSTKEITLVIKPVQGFTYGKWTKIRAIMSDTEGHVVNEAWQFLVQDDPQCYTGLGVLPVETRLQRPLTTFIAMEHLRAALLDCVVPAKITPIRNRDNKAARVIYQTAFLTELSTIQNKFSIKNAAALEVTVCEKENILRIDQAMAQHKNLAIAGIAEFRDYGILSESYTKGFLAYMDSTRYLYRTSLLANLVLYAAAHEL